MSNIVIFMSTEERHARLKDFLEQNHYINNQPWIEPSQLGVLDSDTIGAILMCNSDQRKLPDMVIADYNLTNELNGAELIQIMKNEASSMFIETRVLLFTPSSVNGPMNELIRCVPWEKGEPFKKVLRATKEAIDGMLSF